MRPIKIHERQRKHRMLILLDLLMIMAVTFALAIDMTNTPTVAGRMRLFSYYTIQTNMFVLIIAAWGILSNRYGRVYHYIRAGATLSILVTALAYHLLLSASHDPRGMDLVANVILHYMVPLTALITFGRYMRIYRLNWWAPLGWLVYPMSYIAGCVIRGNLTGDYPYWFVNPLAAYPVGVGSYGQLGLFAGGMGAGFIVLGTLLILANNIGMQRVRK